VRFALQILRLFLAVLIALQLGNTAGFSTDHASALFCNPSGQTVAASDLAQIESLFIAAGKTPPNNEQNDHCETCLTTTFSNLVILTSDVEIAEYAREPHFAALSIGYYYKSQGPPLGGPAPPLFG